MYTAEVQVIVYQLAKYQKDPMKMTEKSQNADSGKENKIIIKIKKRQYNNRKVFRLCRQTLINVNDWIH